MTVSQPATANALPSIAEKFFSELALIAEATDSPKNGRYGAADLSDIFTMYDKLLDGSGGGNRTPTYGFGDRSTAIILPRKSN